MGVGTYFFCRDKEFVNVRMIMHINLDDLCTNHLLR